MLAVFTPNVNSRLWILRDFFSRPAKYPPVRIHKRAQDSGYGRLGQRGLAVAD